MKVKDFILYIQELEERYPDIMEWDLYTEQPALTAPLNGKTLSQTRRAMQANAKKYKLSFNQEHWEDLLKSAKVIKRLEKMGWKFVTDSLGWVYRDTAGGEAFPTVGYFPDKKIVTVNNNY